MTTLLSPADLRVHIETDLSDAALQLILDSEDGEIVRRYGDPDTATEYSYAGGPTITLRRSAISVDTIVEQYIDFTEKTLDPADYRLEPNGRVIHRLQTGPNPLLTWPNYVLVTYVPLDTSDRRKLVLIQLCQLAIRYSGIREEWVGRDYRIVHHPDHIKERNQLLRSLGGSWFKYA